MKNYLFEKYKSVYLNNKLVFLFDTVISTLASFFAILCIYIFSHDTCVNTLFTIHYLALSCVLFIFSELVLHGFKGTIRHMTFTDIFRISTSVLLKNAIMLLVFASIGFAQVFYIFLLFLDFLISVYFLIGSRVCIILLFKFYTENTTNTVQKEQILIYGVKTKAASLVTRLSNSAIYSVEGFISKNPKDNGNRLCDKPILYFGHYSDFGSYSKKHNIKSLLFAHESDAREEMEGLVKYCKTIGLKVLIAPSVDIVNNNSYRFQGKVREIKIEDLLGRDEIQLNMAEIRQNFTGKIILITGAAGSIGSELIRQLASFGVSRMILFDNAETPLHNLRIELEDSYPYLDFVPVIGDVRMEPRLNDVFQQFHPQIVFHAAAYKHVPLMEENPGEAASVNIIGTKNVADKCIEYNVEKMVMISTDKAVNPTNVMGCSKRLAEIYVQALGAAVENGMKHGTTTFVTTRFGNVLGSNGSVIPRFRQQIENGGPITVTHPDINRFFMTIPEACRLVMEAASLPYSNKIFVFDMGEAIKIDTLARKMIELSGLKPGLDIDIKYIGLRPGEKLYEEVLSRDEDTIPTSNNRIKIASVKGYQYDYINSAVCKIEHLLDETNYIPSLITLMKKIVPEYKSTNSHFSNYDI